MDKLPPLISLSEVTRAYPTASEPVSVLRNITFSIHPGEMVAIMGMSGSGKSTLMNIIGCLDKATSGEVHIHGRAISNCTDNELAQLRSQYIGFIFQQYNLLPYLSARENVEIPARYTGLPPELRRSRAEALLQQLGLQHRADFLPSQLSGGQQQRVSVCRALMNNAQIILADEPTGALDTTSGQALMEILHTLHQHGHTIIMVTHDPSIASQAGRIIEISDGEIIADRQQSIAGGRSPQSPPVSLNTGRATFINTFFDAINMAGRALLGHRVRAFLSMLGIIIGIASVVSSIAVGEGAKRSIMEEIGKLGNSTLNIFPGLGNESLRPDMVNALSDEDVESLRTESWVDSVTPVITQILTAVRGDRSVVLMTNGVGRDYFRVKGMRMSQGTPFTYADERYKEPGIVIDESARDRLFLAGENPIGAIIRVDGVPLRVLGVAKRAGPQIIGGYSTAWIPWTSFNTRIVNNKAFGAIMLRVRDGVDLDRAKAATENLLMSIHGRRDFNVQSDDILAKTLQKASDSMSLLITSIAAISLLVGGVGVMNIMLVSVSERTREIGIRLSVGARPADIMLQFLVEAMVICFIGGLLGILFAWLTGYLFLMLNLEFRMVFTLAPLILACVFSAVTGLAFGFYPARNAARLHPTEALRRE